MQVSRGAAISRYPRASEAQPGVVGHATSPAPATEIIATTGLLSPFQGSTLPSPDTGGCALRACPRLLALAPLGPDLNYFTASAGRGSDRPDFRDNPQSAGGTPKCLASSISHPNPQPPTPSPHLRPGAGSSCPESLCSKSVGGWDGSCPGAPHEAGA